MLTIVNAEEGDSGVYQCVVENTAAQAAIGLEIVVTGWQQNSETEFLPMFKVSMFYLRNFRKLQGFLFSIIKNE